MITSLQYQLDRIEAWWFLDNDDDRPYQEDNQVVLDKYKRTVTVHTADGIKVGRIGDGIMKRDGRFYLLRK